MNGKRLLLPVFAVALAVVAATAALADSSITSQTATTKVEARAATPKVKPKRKVLRRVNPRRVRRLRSTVRRWQAVMGVRPASTSAGLHSPRALRYWRVEASRVRRLAANPPHKFGWLCIHRYEGSWQDSGDPYWGGLQMDRGFMETYAPRVLLRRGWADHWTPLEQMWVAERAHRSGRGYWPWPNTAQSCGLL